MKGGSINVNVADGELYRMVTNILEEWRYAWHCYEGRHTRPIRVIQGIFTIRVTVIK